MINRVVLFVALCAIIWPIAAQTETRPVEPVTVELEAGDGLLLIGDFYALPAERLPDDGAPAVLLLHMLGSARGAWEPLVPMLLEAGYQVLAVDMRGHGETGGAQDWPAAEADIQFWLAWLREQPGVRAVAVIGGSIGGNLALIGCAADTACVTAIALSPGLDYRGVQPEDAVVTGLLERSALLIGAHSDGPTAEAVRQMATHARGDIGLRLYQGRAHGTNLLTGPDGPRVIAQIIAWLDEYLNME